MACRSQSWGILCLLLSLVLVGSPRGGAEGSPVDEARAELATTIAGAQIPAESATVLNTMFDDLLKASWDPSAALNFLQQLIGALPGDEKLLADAALWLADEVNKNGNAGEPLLVAWEVAFNVRYIEARRIASFIPAAAEIKRMLEEGRITQAEYDLSGPFLESLKLGEYDGTSGVGFLQVGHDLAPHDPQYLADFAKAVADLVQTGLKGKGLSDALQKQGFQTREQEARRKAEMEVAMAELDARINYEGIPADSVTLLKALFGDLTKAGCPPRDAMSVLNETLEANKRDNTYLPEVARFIADEVGKGTKERELFEKYRATMTPRMESIYAKESGK